MAKQNKRHQAGKRPEITRDLYNTVRKYDRRSFEEWANHIYDCGREDGYAEGSAQQAAVRAAAVKKTAKQAHDAGRAAGLADAVTIISTIKGIGPKKLQEIRTAISKAAEEPKE